MITINGTNYRFTEDPLTDSKYFNFLQPLYTAECNYLIGLQSGLKPQDIRDVLPLATKTEVVMTGYESDWIGFFELRCDTAAHPDMRKLANELKQLIFNESD